MGTSSLKTFFWPEGEQASATSKSLTLAQLKQQRQPITQITQWPRTLPGTIIQHQSYWPRKRDATYTSAVDLWSAGVLLFFLLGGRPPFDYKYPEVISEATFSFEDAPWQHVSVSGMDLISKLLVLDPDRRLSAAEALNHPWFTDPSITDNSVLPRTRKALKRFLNLKATTLYDRRWGHLGLQEIK